MIIAKLVFYLGCMGAGKTTELMKMKDSLLHNNKSVLVFNSHLDKREKKVILDIENSVRLDMINTTEYYAKDPKNSAKHPKSCLINKSVDNKAFYFNLYNNKFSFIKCIEDFFINNNFKIDNILIDEAQFLTKKQIDELSMIVNKYNINIYTFGLRTDYLGNLFEGSKELLIQADKLYVISTKCMLCDKDAVMNYRKHYNGDQDKQVLIGGEDLYMSLCNNHFREKMKKAN